MESQLFLLFGVGAPLDDPARLHETDADRVSPGLRTVGVLHPGGAAQGGALTAIGLGLPGKRIIVNLAPADLAKEGTHFDLPIALAMLIALGALSPDDVAGHVCLGELGLDGSIAGVAGVLPAAMFAARNNMGLICPKSQGGEAAWVGIENIVRYFGNKLS